FVAYSPTTCTFLPYTTLFRSKVYLMIASGGIYSEGMMKDYDFTEKYLKAILGFIGLHDITVFRIEGTAMPEYKENALPKALQTRSEEHTSELQSRENLVCRLL